MSVRRVALIFDNTARPETTGVYCRRALGGLVEVEHFLPAELARIPRGFDLYLQIDDGLDYGHPADLRPAAWWAIDTHLDFERCLRKAAAFDWVFAAQRDGAGALRRAGIAGAAWLPLACDPAVHCKHDVPKAFDICFIGNVFPGARADLLELLRRCFPKTFVGQRYFEEMAKTYSAARLVFNRSIRNDINMRIFEALACGSLLLTNDLTDNGQAELFQDGVHLATYRGADELLDKAAFYLGREELRERLAAAGRAEALARHTYRHRMERLLSDAAQGLARRVVPASGAPRTEGEEADPCFIVPAKAASTPSDAGAFGQPGATAVLGEAALTSTASVSAAPATAAGEGGRDPSYFAHARPELLALIPTSARAVLDVGCGAGRLGEALKARQAATVVGIEVDPRAAGAARERLDAVHVGDVEALAVDFLPGSFDAVVCGDILEHLRDPLGLLRRLRGWLRPDGRLVASIPNVRHHSVLRGLLEGNWTYEPAGLLDRDHLRFFTRREIEKLFYRAGFTVEGLHRLPGPGDDGWEGQSRVGEVRVGRLHVCGLPPEEAAEFYAYQYLVVAAPAVAPDPGLTSIVLLTHNELPYTRLCLDSIRQYTDPTYELIIVDNASTDGTLDYLRALGGVRVLANAENRGFPAAANQGLQAATGTQVLLLNNDTVVTTGWLDRLLRALAAGPRIGLVGPCSNCVSGEQQVKVGYDDLGGLDGFAWQWGKAHDCVLEDTDRLVGFCLLIRRAVLDAVGLLDERFGLGCFEDDDYCRRALRAGFRAVIARDAFVHHFGGRTFVGSRVDFAALMGRNQRLYQEKWEATTPPPAAPGAGPSAPPAEVSPDYTLRAAPGGGLLLEPAHPRLSLCMIVRDNAGTLVPCLESIRPYVDEMVVVDTGSKDDTPQIAARLGARVYHFPWCDDFSAARNESLKYARGDWIFWMDSDDTIDAANGERLRELAYQNADGSSALGYVMQVHCPGPGAAGESDVTVVDHVKLFRNRPALRFDGRIHEQIIPAIRAAGGDIAWTDLFVVHSGSDHSPEGRRRKLDRDFKLLHLELRERPEHPFTLFNLGMTYADAGDYAVAASYLVRSIARAKETESQLRKAYALLVGAYAQLRRHEDAWRACQKGLSLFPEDAELRFREGNLLHDAGRLAEAAAAYRRVLAAREERHFSSVVRGLQGFLTRHHLALVCRDQGDLATAEAEWRRVVEEMPRYRPGWQGLGDVLVRQGRSAEALALAAQLREDPALRAEGLLLQARATEAQGDRDAARQALQQAVQEFTEDAEAQEALCRFLFEHAPPEEAEAALHARLRRNPADASAHHNLGTICLRQRHYEEAAAAYREALRHRPDWSATYLWLGHALAGGGRTAEAIAAWEKVLQLAPDDQAARDALRQVEQAGAA
jgi:GT2 family glycosyltransferase/tetratricopeptide (TPR) repeat protein/2-polyprenyl-3-methyl-5-hydroxy-6-metoxy-1,4-benzoquinol methylase